MLHDITVQGGECARGWEGVEAMSYDIGLKEREGKGGEGRERERFGKQWP